MKLLYLKNEVKINGRHFDPEIRIILDIARKTAPKMMGNAVWVTSANDGRHKNNSKHYSNEAFDLRVWNVLGPPIRVANWAQKIREGLGEDYDVIYGDSSHQDHIHIEYDPKTS